MLLLLFLFEVFLREKEGGFCALGGFGTAGFGMSRLNFTLASAPASASASARTAAMTHTAATIAHIRIFDILRLSLNCTTKCLEVNHYSSTYMFFLPKKRLV